MNIAIFGSCVSRDMCEFIPDSKVVEYVARQSVTSLLKPVGDGGVHVNRLKSPFQQRMVMGDLQGSGARRIASHAKDLDVIFVDLVDERRGYWQFPNSSTMTNSLEAEYCGLAEWANFNGAELVELGTARHFSQWKRGLDALVSELQEAGIWKRAIFLDIEWAQALEGSRHPRGDHLSNFGRSIRRIKRRSRNFRKKMDQGESVVDAFRSIGHAGPTLAEEFSDRAESANRLYRQYSRYASERFNSSISRKSTDMRIGLNHKWGPQPFHYRTEDYLSLVQSVRHVKSDWPWR